MLDVETALAVNGRMPKVPEGTLVYAVGDVHGRADLLEKMHAAILKDALDVPAERKVVVYLGDYVDRGPASKKVVDILLDRPLAGFERVHLMGNHESFLIEFLNDLEAGPGWFFNGGIATLASYGVKVGKHDELSYEVLQRIQEELRRKMPDAHREFYRALEFSRVEGDFFFVHAGIRPGVPLDQQALSDLRWIRDDFLDNLADHGKMIVHGHSITAE
ncbi:MAG: metallophosphoesterase, partial [Alphaproteobacteria bacterium]